MRTKENWKTDAHTHVGKYVNARLLEQVCHSFISKFLFSFDLYGREHSQKVMHSRFIRPKIREKKWCGNHGACTTANKRRYGKQQMIIKQGDRVTPGEREWEWVRRVNNKRKKQTWRLPAFGQILSISLALSLPLTGLRMKQMIVVIVDIAQCLPSHLKCIMSSFFPILTFQIISRFFRLYSISWLARFCTACMYECAHILCVNLVPRFNDSVVMSSPHAIPVEKQWTGDAKGIVFGQIYSNESRREFIFLFCSLSITSYIFCHRRNRMNFFFPFQNEFFSFGWQLSRKMLQCLHANMWSFSRLSTHRTWQFDFDKIFMKCEQQLEILSFKNSMKIHVVNVSVHQMACCC